MSDTHQYISEARRTYFARYSKAERTQILELEAVYGKYLYLTLDLPPPAIDVVKFKSWFDNASKPITRRKTDIAGAVGKPFYSFRSIDARESQDPIWERNVRSDALIEFPGLQAYLDLLPYEDPSFSIWSSQHIVSPHRDEGPWLDLPCAFRCMLYDSNPESTLMIREETTRPNAFKQGAILPRVDGAPSFSWNNVRTTHASFYNPRFSKALLIAYAQRFDITRLADLLERSVTKYEKQAVVSVSKHADFCT